MEKTWLSGAGMPEVGGTEGGRRPTGVPPTSVPAATPTPSPPAAAADPEVSEKPVRRIFSAEYKLRILDEADRCRDHGALGALLRREGLYSSHLSVWRHQRKQGILNGLTPKKRGRKATKPDPVAEENRRLRRENDRLVAQLKKAETIIEFQKKLSELLGIPLGDPPTNETNE